MLLVRTHVRLGNLDGLLGAAGLVLAPSIVILGLLYYHVYYGLGSRDGIIRRGPSQPVAVLTFDDGPSAVYTPRILDILKAKGVKGTFFLLGSQVVKNPEIAKRIFDEGHDIGNHTYSHRELLFSTRRLVQDEVERTEHAIQEVTGYETRLLRPPRGVYSDAVRRLLQGEGYTIALWTVSSRDWQGISARSILRRVKAFTRPGAIMLFHDSGSLFGWKGANRMNTVEALPAVIDYLLHTRGYKIIPLSEILVEQELEAGEAWGKL